MHQKKILSRQELHSLVWEHPLTYFTETFMVSYASFKDICQRNSIPLPPNGYWSKKKYGKEIHKPGLEPISDEQDIILFHRSEGDKRDFGYLTEMDQKILEIEADSKTDFSIPEKLPNKLDPILKETKDWFNNKVKVPKDLDYHARYYPGHIRCFVSKNEFSRALKLLHVLLKNLKARGHQMTFGRSDSFVKINGIEIEISMSEKNKRIKIPGKYGDEYQSEPTGNLSIHTGEYYYSKTWNDAKTIKLEDKISSVLAWLEIEEERERLREIARKEREEKRLEEERIKKEKQKLIDHETQVFRNLIHNSKLWHEAQKLRKYLKNYEAYLEKTNQLTQENIEMFQFGYQKADWIDPLTEDDEELFSDISPLKLLRSFK